MSEAVIIEEWEAPHGWGVFTGCEGDSPNLVAYFLTRAMAQTFLDACQASTDEDHRLCDPQIAPAVLVDGGSIAFADDFRFARCARALAEHVGLRSDIAAAFIEEATNVF